jgi:hypothetical protein
MVSLEVAVADDSLTSYQKNAGLRGGIPSAPFRVGILFLASFPKNMPVYGTCIEYGGVQEGRERQ